MKDEQEERGRAARSFEELHFYQRARELTNAIYRLTRTGAWSKDFGLVDQIRRAAVSVMSNTAEGFERGTSTEFIQFLYIAKGSCGEVRAQLQVAADQGYVSPDQHAALVDLARRTSGMISNFIGHLQKTDYRGEKFARPRRQRTEEAGNRQEAFRAAQLRNIQSQQRACEQRATASTPSPLSHPSHPSHEPAPLNPNVHPVGSAPTGAPPSHRTP